MRWRLLRRNILTSSSGYQSHNSLWSPTMASDAIINPVYSLNGLSVSLLALTDATSTRLLSLDICTLEELARIALQTPITVRSELTTLIQLGLTQLRACAPTWLAQTQPIAPWVQPETA